MIKSRIVNGNGNDIEAEVTHDNAVKVANVDYYKWTGQVWFYTNPTYGNNMAINASNTGTPENIHNGIDNVYWTASSIVGGSNWNFQSTTQAHTGTRSISGVNTVNNDVAQISKGSDLDLTSFNALAGWIYITQWALTGVKSLLIYGYDTNTSSIVGTSVDIANYINVTNHNTWQKFTIPLSDMLLDGQTIDSIRIAVAATGTGVAMDWFLDDIQFESAGVGGGTQTFKIEPDQGYIYEISSIFTTYVDSFATTLTDATVPYLLHDQFLGQTFQTGFIWRRTLAGEIIEVNTLPDLTTLLSYGDTKIHTYFSDGLNRTFLKTQLKNTTPMILDSRTNDSLEITLTEDFSGFDVLNWNAQGRFRKL